MPLIYSYFLSYKQKLYTEIPFFAKFSAQWNVTNHLSKLRADGRVDHSWPDQWTLRNIGSNEDDIYVDVMSCESRSKRQ